MSDRMEYCYDRVRIYQLHERSLVELFNIRRDMSRWPDQICMPVLEPLPEDAIVYKAWYSEAGRCWEFLVGHEIFDSIPPYDQPPRGDDPLRIEKRWVDLRPAKELELLKDDLIEARKENLKLREQLRGVDLAEYLKSKSTNYDVPPVH